MAWEPPARAEVAVAAALRRGGFAVPATRRGAAEHIRLRRFSMRMLSVAGAALCAALLTSCGGSSKPQDLIIGKWQLVHDQGGPAIVDEYTREGKVIGYQGDNKFNEKGYTFADDQTLQFTPPGGGQAFATYKVAVAGDELTLTGGDGRVQKFKRVR
jgi:hypothetical protein